MLTFYVKLRWQDYASVTLSTDDKKRVQQYRLRKIKECYLPWKSVGFALIKQGMNRAVQPNGDATGQAAHTKSRQGCPGKGSQPFTTQPLSGGCPGPVEESPALRAGGGSGQPGLAIRATLAQSREVAAALQMVPWSITLHRTPLTRV